MLTREAFNALLKTLEEPPAHVVFILATTEAHKLPETIISRTQRFTFRPAAPDKVIALLKQIAKTEKITIDDDALTLIAEHGDGSFRDSVSLLDQASSTAEHVTRADIERILGLAPAEQVTALRTAVANHQTEAIVTVLTQLYSDGYEPAAIATQLSAVLRHAVLQGGTDATDLLNLLQQLLEVPGARSPRQLLELILLRAGLTGAATPLPAVAPTIQATTFSPAAPEPKATPPKAKTEPKIESSRPPAEVAATTPTDSLTTPAASEPVPVAAPAASAITTADITELWQQALEEIKKQYNTLYGIARMAKPVLTDGTLTLAFKFPFHQKRVNEPKNRQIFAELMERLYGSPLEILCVVAEESDSITAPTPDVAAISNIFGGAELLES